jgi:GT2 family glycosyltransferase
MAGSLISIIILNWNGSECITECVESVEKTIYKNIEIIIVDNASTDDSLEKIKNNFPDVHLIELKENIGYAAGNNRGFQKAQGEFIATLNNDTVVDPKWLSQPIAFLENDKTIGIIACRQMKYNDHEIIDCLYSYPLRSLLFQPMGSGKKYSSKELYSQPGFVLGAGGASAIYRKKLLDELDGFDERYYSYHEESDLCMRAFLSGWKCMYAPSSIVYHRGSFSYNRIKKQFGYYHERKRIWFIYKFYPKTFFLKNIVWISIMALRLIRVHLFKQKTGFGLFTAWFYGMSGLKAFQGDRMRFIEKFREKQWLFNYFIKDKKLRKLPQKNVS